MKKSVCEYIFYTTEGITQAPTGKIVENMQILGFEKGVSESCALTRLLKSNPWIEEKGFSPCKIVCRKVFPH